MQFPYQERPPLWGLHLIAAKGLYEPRTLPTQIQRSGPLGREWPAVTTPADSQSTRRFGPYHRLQEAVDRIDVHCQALAAQGIPAENIEALKLLADRFTRHFVALERLRSRTVQLTELWERP